MNVIPCLTRDLFNVSRYRASSDNYRERNDSLTVDTIRIHSLNSIFT